jgi:hypothetical protein
VKLNPETLARASSRHPGRTVAIWAVILVLGFGASAVMLSSALTTDFDFSNNPEAKQAKTILDQEKLEQDVIPETFVMTTGSGTVTDPAFQGQVNAALNDLRALGADVVTTVPASYPLPADQQNDPQVAALGPIDSHGGPVHGDPRRGLGPDCVAREPAERHPRSLHVGRYDDVHARRADLDRRLQEDL